MDETVQRLYEADLRFGRILGFFTLVTILIACLGLLGLASFMTCLRTREIGVRKVLGASMSGLLILLSKDFIKLVLLALVIATPLSWYFIRQWLQEFPYHAEIAWWIFGASGVAAIFIAFLAVGFQSLKVAMSNPVESLRNE